MNVAPKTPVTQTERLTSIDVLRGFALLGILVMNIQSFGMIGAKYMNPMAEGPLEGSSYWIWWVGHVFFDTKMMAIFSMLFGAGIVLMWERAQKAGKKFTGLHYRRTFWLLLFGLAHAHILWMGDILFCYAICGMFVYWLCGLKARWLIPIGLLVVSVASILSMASQVSMPYWDEAQKTEMAAGWVPSQEYIDEEIAAYRGTWFEQSEYRVPGAIFMETFLIAFLFFWRAGGLMLIGMGLFKLGIFSAARSNRFYTIGAVVGLAVGLATVIYGVYQNNLHEWSFEFSFFAGTQFNYWGSLFVSFGYVCVVMLMCKLDLLGWLRKSLAAVGQMALTNYLMQTIICTTLFYGHGLGWFAQLDRAQLLAVVFSVWAFQMIASPIWLKYYRFGPFEWLWRSLAYWKVQPLRRA